MPVVQLEASDGRARAGIVALSSVEGGLSVATPAIVFRTNSGALPYVTPTSVDEAIPRLARWKGTSGGNSRDFGKGTGKSVATPVQAILSVDVASVHWVYGSVAGATPRSEKPKEKATGYGPTAELSRTEASAVLARGPKVGGDLGGIRGFPMLAGWPVLLSLDNAVTQTVSVATPEMYKQRQAKERGAKKKKSNKKKAGRGKGEEEKEEKKKQGATSPVTLQPPASKRRKTEPREDAASTYGDALLIRDGRECVTVTPRSMVDVAAASGASLFALVADLEGLRPQAGRKRRKLAADRSIAWIAEAGASIKGKGDGDGDGDGAGEGEGEASLKSSGGASVGLCRSMAYVAGLGSPVETMHFCRGVASALSSSSGASGVVLRGVGAVLPPSERRKLMSACVRMLRGEESGVVGGAEVASALRENSATIVGASAAAIAAKEPAKITRNPELFIVASSQARDAAMGPAEILSCIAEGCDAVSGDWAEEMTLQGRAAAFVLEGDASDDCANGGAKSGGAPRCSVSLRDFAYKEDGRPLPGGQGGSGFSRAYVHHLLNTHEMLAQTLLFAHNCSRLLDLVAEARTAVVDSRFEQWRTSFLERNCL